MPTLRWSKPCGKVSDVVVAKLSFLRNGHQPVPSNESICGGWRSSVASGRPRSTLRNSGWKRSSRSASSSWRVSILPASNNRAYVI